MATASREQAARALLRKASRPAGGSAHAHAPPHARRAGRYRPPTPTPEELEQREQGWNGRFFRDTPSEPKRPANRRASQSTSAALSPQQQKEKKIRDERQQYGAHNNSNHRSPARDASERAPAPALPQRRLAPLSNAPGGGLGLPPSVRASLAFLYRLIVSTAM
ncbi:hypothetical protein PINS_up004714 [Pythium insidiosum]|nr:hypothetical protein PINS_up004714 [Pythium insidiosum]